MTDELDWILLHYGGYCCGQVEASDVDKQFFEAKQAIQALIDQECNKARIDELKEVEIACHNSPDPYTYARKLTYQDFLLAKDRRLAELSNKENK